MDENVQRILSDTLTPTKAAELAGVAKPTIYRWINSGLLPVYRDATDTIVIMRSDLETVVRSKAVRVSLMAEEAEKTLEKLRKSMSYQKHGAK